MIWSVLPPYAGSYVVVALAFGVGAYDVNRRVVRRISMWFLLWAFALTGSAQTVQTLQWPTKYAAKPPTNIDSRWLATFRIGLSAVNETQAVGVSGTAAQALGLPQEQAGRLQKLLVPLYEQIKLDDAFAAAKSALPYCYSVETPTNGIATAYFPAKLDTNKAPIVFLHGYGGSFLWPIHLLAGAFPDRVIIAPAYGMSGGNMHPLYVQQALRAAQEALKLEDPLSKPILVGLSAGGSGLLPFYGPRLQYYLGGVCLASYPSTELIGSYRAGHILEFICGDKEFYVQNQILDKGVQMLEKRGVAVKSVVLKNADHFFPVEYPELTKQLLREAVGRIEAKAKEQAAKE